MMSKSHSRHISSKKRYIKKVNLISYFLIPYNKCVTAFKLKTKKQGI